MFKYPNVPRCQHIKTNGTRCGSPALRNHNLCFFHQRWHNARIVMPRNYPNLETRVELPVLEDANAIQMALTQVMRLILMEKITDKQAGRLLHALQIASLNLKNTRFEDYDEHRVVIDPATLARAGVGIDSWRPADFPDPLPANPKPEATFTPDPSEPVFYDGKKLAPPPPAATPADAKKPPATAPAPAPNSARIPEIKAQAENHLLTRRCRKARPN
jgi:hypothetical protein